METIKTQYYQIGHSLQTSISERYQATDEAICSRFLSAFQILVMSKREVKPGPKNAIHAFLGLFKWTCW